MATSRVDAKIRRLAAAGDMDGAATEALRALGPQVLRYQRSVLHDEDGAKEAFSAFAESLWRGLPAFRWDASLRTWAFRLAWSAAQHVRRDAWRRRGRRLATTDASKLAEEVCTSSAMRVERQLRALEKLMSELPLTEQSLLALRVGEGLSWEEIAAVMGRGGSSADAGTLAKRFSRLKARLAAKAKSERVLE